MFGWTDSELLGKKMHDVIHYKHPDGTPFPASDCPVLQILQEGIELRDYQDMFIRKNGCFFPVVFSASPLKKDDKTMGIVVGFTDDPKRREIDQALREGEERFRMVANTVPVMIWMGEKNNLCTYFNEPWLEFTGRPLEEQLGIGWRKCAHSEDVGRCVETYTRAFERREPFQMEYRLRRYDGEYRWVLSSGVPRYDRDGSFAGYIGTAVDVTEHKVAQEALSSVSRRLIEAHEEERTRIARELHDDIGQRLALLRMNLDRLGNEQTSRAEFKAGIGNAVQCVANLGRDVQAMSHRLHSSKLEYFGLATAAAIFCDELADQHKVEIDLQSENIPDDLSGEIALCMFRVLQEALQNAIKHSRSQQFVVSFSHTRVGICVTVRDSGIGFDPVEAINGRGLGLVSMKERLKLVGGELSIQSEPRAGTTIHACVPLNPNR